MKKKVSQSNFIITMNPKELSQICFLVSVGVMNIEKNKAFTPGEIESYRNLRNELYD